MINSINTNIAAYYAQANIGRASAMASNSVARLSSGNRIIQASQDVAALAIGTGLRTAVSALRTALTNASQGTSLLQVADGALSQITEILQRQRAIAFQAGSGTLRAEDRGFLEQEFTSLSAEIQRLSESTNFNGVRLLDGSLSEAVRAVSNSSNAAPSSMSLTFTADNTGTQTVIINGITITAGTQFTNGGANRELTVTNLMGWLNNVNSLATGASDTATTVTAATRAALGGMVYSQQGTTLTMTSRSGGPIPQGFTVSNAGSGTWTNTVNGQGGQTSVSVTGIAVGSIDTNVGGNGTGDHFANGVLTYDGTTIATVANGDTLRTIMNQINALTVSTGVRAFITGSSGANGYTLNVASADETDTGALAGVAITTATGMTTNPAANTDNAIEYSVGGGAGLGYGTTIGNGTTGGTSSLVTDQLQQVARSIISYGSTPLTSLTGATITIEGEVFTFTSNNSTVGSQTEIRVGSTIEETLDNAVAALNNFSGLATVNYAFSQIEATRDGTNLVIRNRTAGNALDIAGGTLSIAASVGTVSNADLSSTTNTGIDTHGVMNADFSGTIQGFSASYVSANTIDMQLSVGGIVYRARNVGTAPTANTDVRFVSDTGGFFVVKMRANAGMNVSDTAGANTFAQRMDAAFSGVNFSQTRLMSSYNPTGDLIGSSVRMQLSDFSSATIQDINVQAPTGSNPNGSISFTINGEQYTAQVPLGSVLGARSVTRFVSASDVNKFVEFVNGSTPLDFSSAENAASVEQALKDAFGVKAGATSLSFQIGTSAGDTLAVSINNATTGNLYSGETLSVLTQASATHAAEVLDQALNTVTGIRANVGALQSRFNFASANIQISVQNQDAAGSELLDTDVATESTAYATAQVKLQAGISVLAQANQQLQALLKLIG